MNKKIINLRTDSSKVRGLQIGENNDLPSSEILNGDVFGQTTIYFNEIVSIK